MTTTTTTTTASPPSPTSYDRFPYPGSPHALTHPDRLAAAATLCGMSPPPVGRCRVLELGCGDGANLIPVAFALPGCTAVGVDLSPTAVQTGQATVEALGLTNVTLRVGDVTDLPADLGGPFDYVVAHGLYSWVPAPVRNAVLAACARLLAPAGVAYVSYNAYPGHHFRQLARDVMLYGAAGVLDPQARITSARDVLAAVAATRPEADRYGSVLREEVKRVREKPDPVFFHDDLEAVNAPVYFHQFVDHAARHGLQFLTEAEYAETAERALPPDAAKSLAPWTDDDVLRREQFADFTRCRAFRRTLLCRAGIPLVRPVDPANVAKLRAAANVTPVGKPADGTGAESFRNAKGVTLSTNRPLVRAALRRLGKLWPRSVPFDELLTAVVADVSPAAAELEGTPDRHPAALAEALLAGHAANLVEFRTADPALAVVAGDRPVAAALPRHQARTSDLVTNLLGVAVRLEGTLARQLLLRLDGTRDRRTLAGELAELVSRGEVSLSDGGTPVRDARRAAKLISASLDENLDKLARIALLTDPV